MIHAVFISYASKDKKVADEICSTLEARGTKCWIAHRDNVAGHVWAKGIAKAITSSQVMVFILSNSSASPSEAIMNEIVAADNKGIPIVVLRIDNVEPSEELAFYIRKYHWIDAFGGKLKDHLQELANAVENLIVPPKADTETVRSETKRPPIPKKQRSFLFWLGLISFILSCGIITAFCTVGLAAHGHGPTAFGPVFGYTLPAMLLGILFIWLSRRQLRKRWFWPGIILFTVGLASSPSILSVLNQFPDVSPLFTLIASGLFVIIGGLCLWRGWPQEGVSHPRREFSIFLIVMLLLMVTFITKAGIME